ELAVARNPVTASVGRTLAANPEAQLVAGTTAAGSAELARQGGAGPIGQTVAGMAGGIAGGVATGRVVGNLETPTPKTSLPAGAATTATEAAALRHVDDVAQTIAEGGASKIGLNWSSLDDDLKSRM